MSLSGTLNIGKSALAVSQAALQVTGNNVANAGNENYTRQVAKLSTAGDQQFRPGVFVGTGVDLDSITRQIDDALEQRLRSATSDQKGADVAKDVLSRVEGVFNALGDNDLSSQLSKFFKSWSDLANKPQDTGLRQVVLQAGKSVSSWFTDLKKQVASISTDVQGRLTSLAKQADGLAAQVATLNRKISITEAGSGEASGLRDQRDTALKSLAELIDIKTEARPNGMIDVYVGSEPLVINDDNRGVIVKTNLDSVTPQLQLAFRQDNGTIPATNGQLGALVSSQQSVADTVKQVDDLARNFIFELNKIHSSGQGLEGFATATATNAVERTDVALNDTRAGLKFDATNGSFVVHVKNKASGLVTSTLVQVNLAGTGGDTTLDSLTADVDAVANISAKIVNGKLTVTADSPAVDVSFSQDSSGALAALGVNNFFTGSDAGDIAVSKTLLDKPALLSAAKNGSPGDNQTARAIATLETKALDGLNGVSLISAYDGVVNATAASSQAARTGSEASREVLSALSAQRESLSGVSLDEEAINLMRQQRAFQGAARLISVVNEMMDTVMGLVR